ncbi:MAG: hypothetical protein A2X86_20940 [Bdellovibrionales bacterium GWA2_49_15]|nr:MAG: hypothetical protein A2X86_20940 [Bdellovibrionales bacterium GWA2_49_15]HAZ14845.1 hypothetical protein [Bdellovibrionales bacterium]
MKKKFLLGAVMMVSTILYSAELPFQFTNISLQGTGCPEGTYQVVLSPNNQALSVLFDQFTVQAPMESTNAGGRRVDNTINNKICDIIVKANLKEGEQVANIKVNVDLRGAVQLDPMAEALVRTLFLEWTGPRGFGSAGRAVVGEKQWRNLTPDPLDEEWQLSQEKNILTDRSHCARGHDREIKFVIKNVIFSRINPAAPNSLAVLSLDSADVAGSLRMQIGTRPCTGGAPSVGNGNGNGGGRPTPPITPGPNRPFPAPGPSVGGGAPGHSCPGGVWNPGLRRCVF